MDETNKARNGSKELTEVFMKQYEEFLGKRIRVAYLDWGDETEIEGILTKATKRYLKVDGFHVPTKHLFEIKEVV